MALNKPALTKRKFMNAADYLPKGKKAQSLLIERATILAAPPVAKDEENKELHKYIHFKLGTNEQYGVPYEFAIEVLSHVHVTPVPCSDFFLTGTMNYRGLLIAVIDLEKLFYKKSTINQHTPETFIIIIQYKNITLGIITNYIYGSDTYNKKKLEPPLPVSSILKSDYIIGIHQGKIAIINIPCILMDNLLIKTTT